MDDTFWSEYKITFCEPTKCIVNYIISKGFVYDDFSKNHFVYNQFNNYFSRDLDEKLIGLKDLSVHTNHCNLTTESTSMIYMSEKKFNRINNELSMISQSDIDYCLSSSKKRIMIKRGIILDKNNGLHIIIYGTEGLPKASYTFSAHRGYRFCNLELVRIKSNDQEGFKSVEEEIVPDIQAQESVLRKLVQTSLDDLDDYEEPIKNNPLLAAERRGQIKRGGTVANAVDSFKKNFYELKDDARQAQMVRDWQS